VVPLAEDYRSLRYPLPLKPPAPSLPRYLSPRPVRSQRGLAPAILSEHLLADLTDSEGQIQAAVLTHDCPCPAVMVVAARHCAGVAGLLHIGFRFWLWVGQSLAGLRKSWP
jgi:hypothetical protein